MSDNVKTGHIRFPKKENKSESSDGKTGGSFGSLFNPVNIKSDVSRVNEFPRALSEHFMGIDEFCSTNASSFLSDARLQSRSYFDELKSRDLQPRDLQPTLNITGNSRPNSIDSRESSKDQPQRKHSLNKDVIAEMDRQYDHNVCLDRFIHEMECRQQHNNAEKIETNLGVQTRLKGELVGPDLIDDTTKPDSSNGKSDSCSNCSNSLSCGCTVYTSGSSSLAPRSTETDSGSRGSSSIKSSNSENNNQNKSNETDPKPAKVYKSNNSDAISTCRKKLENEGESSGVYSGSTSGSQRNQRPTKHQGGKPGRKRKRGYIYDPKPVKGKPSKEQVPESKKDTEYWEKRKRNNEAARKSREMRRRKEIEVSKRMQNLIKENQSLRASVCLLIKQNEALEMMLREYEIGDGTDDSLEIDNSSNM